MNSSFVILTATLLSFLRASEVMGTGPIYQLVSSTARIIGRLCFANGGANQRNQSLIDQFFGCYDNAPGKPQFVKCQTQVWEGPLNNTSVVAASCTNQLNLVSYGSCLWREFRNAGLDMTSTVLTLNACQSKVLGIN